MKNRINNLFGVAMLAVFALSSCSDEFLEEKKNYDNVSTDIYNYVSGCNGRVNDVYSWCLPQTTDMTWKFVSIGNADAAGKSTEEYSGFSVFVDPQNELTSMSSTNGVPDYFVGDDAKNIQSSVYGRIRNINDVIEGISGGSIDQEDKDKLLGQVYFFRAWCYYILFKWYGGVPILKEVLDPVEDAFTPRSSAKEVYDFIVSDLDKAAELLQPYTESGQWSSGSEYGRVTSGTALALKGRVMLLWASPLFNRSNDESRWTTAYETMKSELSRINACGYALYTDNSNVNGSTFAKVFMQSANNPEAVFFTQHNDVVGDGLDNQKNNNWERTIRPANTGGSGKQASAMLIDLFPMSDGKIPAGADTYTKLESSSEAYDSEIPFVNRDPRFYRTFCFPGFRWAFNGDAQTIADNNPNYNNGHDYVLWNYVWYESENDAGDPESGNSYAADNLGDSKAGVYVRKKSDDYDVSTTPLYNYENTKGSAAPFFSKAQLIELRYAEVLLNLAEAACGAGHMDEAVTYLQQIRARAGYTAANNYGLQSNLSSDQAACMSAILYERQIEFAYEGKRFDDCRRWMLYDGGATQPAGAPSTWTLTGWGGNTCTWLGVKPLNGQRRENIQYRVGNQYGTAKPQYGLDPLLAKGTERSFKSLIATTGTDDDGNESTTYTEGSTYTGVDLRKTDLVEQLRGLRQWYKDNLVYKVSKGDARDSQKSDLYMNFLPKYYLLGLSSGAMNENVGLEQTIGWEDYNNGGAAGTFDPLATTAQ